MCSLGIEPTTFAMLTQCSTTEPQDIKVEQKHISKETTINIYNDRFITQLD